MKYLFFRVSVFPLLVSFSFGENPLAGAKERLSDYGFFIGKISEQIPNEGVIPYDISAELFSDYALKARFIHLPKGQKLNYRADGTFDYPIGTTLIKTFYYPADFRTPSENQRNIETRLLILSEKGWRGYPYVWNEDQTDAFFEIAGERKDVSFIDLSGNKISFNYSVPNFNQCKSCHVNENQMIPIGPKVRLLNHQYQYPDGKMNQLEKWSLLEMINGLPELTTLPHTSNYEDPNDGSLNDRARAWIDINCAHCHITGAPGETSGLFLNIEEINPAQLGILKPPVAAGRGAGNRLHTIVPGKPDESILIYRIESSDPGIMMPEIGRKLVHKEGVALIREWIREMNN